MKSYSVIIQLAFSFIFLAIFAGVFYFLNLTINKNDALAEATNLEWQNEALKREEIRALARALKMVEAESTNLNKHFAYSSDLVPFLDTVEALGVRSGVNLVETNSVNASTDGLSLTVGLNAKGDFNSIYKFASLLENSPYQLQTTSLNMQREGGEGASTNPVWMASFNLKLVTFFK